MRKQLDRILISAIGVMVFMAGCLAMAQMPYTTTRTGDCGAGYGAPRGRVGLHRVADPEGGWQTKGFVVDSFGPMPQTAYDPNFGCYPGNARTIHRYPAFHGYYYDTPANYRHYSEYPWNADIAEPRPYPNTAQPAMGMEVQVVTPAPAPVTSSPVIMQEVPQTEETVDPSILQ